MIVDQDLTTEIGIGTERRMPQEGDSQLLIPPLGSLTIPLQAPSLFGSDPLAVHRKSAVSGGSTSRTNQAAATTIFMTLAPGMYRMTAFLTARANYENTGAGAGQADVSLRLTNQSGSVWQFLGLYAHITDPSSVTLNFEVLLIDVTTVAVRTEANGVGQTLDAFFSVCATRIL